ncbi:MAG: hypothetical protein DMF75_10895 [Acidobacteria bacterium]|nr:MAG: hypothetical protein DMF75_10895 [Acidobacteriota bacterium]
MSEDPTKRFPKAPGDNGEEKLDQLFAAVEALRGELRSEVSSLRSELHNEASSLRSELSALSETVEHRLYDTRPMWESVLAEMENLKSRVDVLETTVRDGLKDMGHLFRTQYVDVIRVQRDLEERVTELEQKPA